MLLNINVIPILQNNKDYVLTLRRHLHQNPEPSFKEYETSRFISEQLQNMGVPHTRLGETGIIADIAGGKSGKTIALRADIDGLEVQEENTFSYKSQKDGLMHACGHDGHTAMLLGAAKTLSQIKDSIEGNIRFIFQPAEENVQGAKVMVEGGCLHDVDTVFGMHLWAHLPVGKISVEKGPRMAAADIVNIEFIGRGGHGSAPHQGVDAIMASSAFITGVQSVISRELSPEEAAVISIGKIVAGTRFNVIAEHARLEGTVRIFSKEVGKFVKDAIFRYATNIAAAYRATAKIEYVFGTPPLINEEAASELAEKVVIHSFGKDSLVTLNKTTGSEDFSYYLEQKPGVFAFVGAGKTDGSPAYPHHHSKFEIDEDALFVGTKLYVAYALAYLGSASTIVCPK